MEMNAALILLPVVKKNRKTFEKTILVNNNKVKNFRQDEVDTDYTLVYYATFRKRTKRDELKVALTVAQVDARVREEANEPVIPLYITKKGGQYKQKKVINRVEYINVDSWVWAWNNSDGVTCTIWIDEGAFELIKLEANHTIEQISARASASASFSESGI